MSRCLGIAIPYYKNSEQCEVEFKKLMQCLEPQLTDDMMLCVYEDGQQSDWLKEYAGNDNIVVLGCKKNYGVSYARNLIINCIIDKVDYILFLDSDDKVADNYLTKVHEYCADRTHEIIETMFFINGVLMRYNPKEVRSCAASSAIATKIIGEHRFKENVQIGEDTEFMNEIVDLTKYRKKYCPVEYY